MYETHYMGGGNEVDENQTLLVAISLTDLWV